MFAPIPVNLSVSPVVLVPGIGGSILSDVNSGLQVWIRLYEATYYFQRYMWGRYNDTSQVVPARGSCVVSAPSMAPLACCRPNCLPVPVCRS